MDEEDTQGTVPSQMKKPLNPIAEHEEELQSLKIEYETLNNLQHMLLKRKKNLLAERDKLMRKLDEASIHLTSFQFIVSDQQYFGGRRDGAAPCVDLKKKKPPGHLETTKMPLAYSVNKLLCNQQILPYFINFLDSFGEPTNANEKSTKIIDSIELVQFLMHLQSFYSSFDNKNGQCEEEKLSHPSRDIFRECEGYVLSQLESGPFPAFKDHSLFKKHEIECLQNPTLTDVVHVDVLLQELLELLQCSQDRTDLQFILACDAFEDEFRKSSAEQAVEDAMGIYDRYISLQATSPIDVSSAERFKIETGICQPNGYPLQDCFRALRGRLGGQLEKRYLSALKSSQVFWNYQGELSSTSESMTPRSSVSETSRSRLGSVGEKSWTDEPTTSKTNSFAQVDNLGRYKCLIDDSKWKSEHQNNKLKYKLTKYLNRKAAKEEEEATEAALAIIQDVHRMVRQRSVD